jgi:hypothetical protein
MKSLLFALPALAQWAQRAAGRFGIAEPRING